MRIGSMEFQPSPGLTLAVLVVVAVCCALGAWQLSRAEEKSELAEIILQRTDSKPQPIDSVNFNAQDDIRYVRVSVQGRFDYPHQFYVPNRKHQGQSGLHVITPFETGGSGKRILVNRGWIGDAPPPGTHNNSQYADNEITLTGRLVRPARPPLRLGPANSDPSPWHQRWLFADPELYGKASGNHVHPMILLMDTNQPGRFQRSWKLPQPNPWMHYGYAIHWFAIAVIALVVGGVLSKRKGTRYDAG